MIKQIHMSLDPAMISWMSPDTESYIPPIELGSVMRSSEVGVVVDSNHPDFSVDDRAIAMMRRQGYFLTNGEVANKVEVPVPDETVISVLASPGQVGSGYRGYPC